MLGSLGTSLELRRWPFRNFSGSQGTFDGCQAFNWGDRPVGGVRQMKPLSWFGAGQDGRFRRVRRTANVSQIAGWRRRRSARGWAVLPAADYPTSVSLNRLAYEYGLKDELDGASASPDLELVRERGEPR